MTTEPGHAPATTATRELVRSTALRLFRDRGFAATTMRAIAQEAGVATGIAYYYFGSKDDLVQELYLEVNADHVRRARAALGAGGDLADRLRTVLLAGVDAFAEYHEFGTEFVTVALRPGSAASPFSPASGPARELSQELFVEVVEGAGGSVPAHLREQLPELLWLAQLGLTLFWVHDSSPGARRTRAVAEGAASLVGRLVRLARLPVARGVVDDMVALARAVRA